jgi:hypothetical protein
MTATLAADLLRRFRGDFPTQDLDARRIAGLLEAPNCDRRLVIDAASLNLPVLTDLLDCPPAKMSPHATRRGQEFERRVLDNAMDEVIALTRVHLGMVHTETRQLDLAPSQMRTQNPDLDTSAIRRLRVARTRSHIEAMVNSSDAALHLIRHPLLELDLAGVTTYLEMDVLSCATLGQLTPVEIKSFPLHHQTDADPHKVGAAVRQTAVYMVALRRLVAASAGSGDQVADRALLIMTSGFSLRPEAYVVDMRPHVDHLEWVLAQQPNAGLVLADLPRAAALPSPPAPDATTKQKHEITAATKEAVSALPMHYGDGCATCPMLAFCTSEAKLHDSVAQLGTQAANACGSVGTIAAAFDLIAGRRTPATGAERAVAADFGRAAAALALAGVQLDH